ncbi:sigma-70 family RNA polymerase sigma factor [Streptomyces sp. BBFR2]|uniref:sigma-70 family RNA polymerase sigma factor n=1 Tax=Streptomyces sp. BBFR2 TaxID=3372854 RepID=UPI0037D9D09F
MTDETTHHEAFLRGLYAHHRTALEHYVMRVGGVGRETAEDLVQETFLRAWRNAAKLDRHRDGTGDAMRPWLLRVARNLVIDAYRAKNARPRQTADPTPPDTEAVPDGAEQVALAQDMAGVLALLSPPHREVVVHLHCMDRSIPDTARTIGVPTGTVKSRNHYALKELRRIVAESGMAG